jgi:tetratricopeptide (TPR) repeat protein
MSRSNQRLGSGGVSRNGGRGAGPTAWVLAFAMAVLSGPVGLAQPEPPALESLVEQARRALAEGSMTAARKLIQRALAADGDDSDALYLAGQLEYSAGHPEKAREPLERAARAAPDNFAVRFLLGAVLVELRESEAALRHLEKANRLRPDHADAAKLLAIEYNRMLRSRDAVRVLAPLLEPERADEEAYLLALDAYHKSGDRRQALLAAETAAGRFPDSGRIAGWLGYQYAQNGEFGRAIELLEKAIRLEPEDHAAYYVMGDIMLKQERYRDAISSFRSGLARKPDHGEGWAGLAKALVATGELHRALHELRRGREMAPKDPAIRFELSKLYFRLGDEARAQAESEAFQRLREQSGSSAP